MRTGRRWALVTLMLAVMMILVQCTPAATPVPPTATQPQPTTEATTQPQPAVDSPTEPPAEVSTYNEAPALKELVDQGELPPVDQRLPEEPLVIQPAESIGQYGGVLRRGFLGPSDANHYVRLVYDALVRFGPMGDEVIPHLAESVTPSADYKTWTVKLRKGTKWSDGQPFTTDDILFWYNDCLLNEDLTPTVPAWMTNGDGSVVEVQKVDDVTVTFRFNETNTNFMLDLANRDGADRSLAPFLPAHYLRQFHVDHADADELASAIQEAGVTTWTELFMARAMPPENPERPVTGPWMPVTSVAEQVFTLERNPYFFAVDPEGNQLPYIDEVRFTFFTNAQTLNLAAIAGEFDLQERHIDMTNYPVLKEYEQQGMYKVITWPTFGGSDAAVYFNQTLDGNPAVAELLRNVSFRQALSYAINREEIKESAFLGLGEARQTVPAPWHPYYPGDEYAYKYTQYNPDEANRLLDSIGLDQKDDQGIRLMSNGEPILIELDVVPAFGPWPDVAQMVARDWENVGVRTIVQVRERSLHIELGNTGKLETWIWNNDQTSWPFSGQPQMDPRSPIVNNVGRQYQQWYASGGAEGMEPTEDVKALVALIDEAKSLPPEDQVAVGQEFYRQWVDNLYQVGTVGLTAMVQGVVVYNNDLHNVPAELGNAWPLRTPGNGRPEQLYFAQN